MAIQPRRSGAPIAAPNLHSPTPDPGLVHPYGDVAANSDGSASSPDSKVWTCTQCGYQWERAREPTQCPNCAGFDVFTRQL